MLAFSRLAVAVVLSAALAGCGGEGGELEILSVQPRTGQTQGGQRVMIGGKNFRTDIGYTVFFGAHRSLEVTTLDPETLLVLAPATEEAGTVDITLRSDDGVAFKISQVFNYTAAPAAPGTAAPAEGLAF